MLRCLYGDIFDVKIVVDHSCGYDRQHDDASNSVRMNVHYGEKQARVHDSKIRMKHGYLRNHNPLLSVVNTQKMNRKKVNRCPIFMAIDEHQLLISGNNKFKMIALPKPGKSIRK